MTKPVTVVSPCVRDYSRRSIIVPEVIEKIGVAKPKTIPVAVLFHRVRVKNSTKFRVWPVLGDYRFIEMDPTVWREKYAVVVEYKTDAPSRPS